MSAASWEVFEPGAAHASQTRSPGAGSSTVGGMAETSSWPWSQPQK